MRSPSSFPTAAEVLALSMLQLLELLLGGGSMEDCNVNGTLVDFRVTPGDFSLFEPSQIIDIGRAVLLFFHFSSWIAVATSRSALVFDEADTS